MGEIFRQERSEAALSEAADDRIARLHRYYVARQYCHGRDVLDLSAGDGSGAAVLAQIAASVLAVTADGAAFTAPNLRFTADDNGAGAFDVVLAFDVIERQQDQDAWVDAIRARLRPDGVLLIATPNGDREDAVLRIHVTQRRQIGRQALVRLLDTRFAQVRVFGQRGLIGSAMMAAQHNAGLLVVEHRDRLHADVTAELPRATELFGVASDASVAAPDSLFIDSDVDALATLQARAVQAEALLGRARADLDTLAARLDGERSSDAQWRQRLAVLRVSEAAADTRYRQALAAFEAERGQLMAERAPYMAVLAGLQAREQNGLAQIEHLQNVVRMDAVHIQHLHHAAQVDAVRLEQAEQRATATDNHIRNLEAEAAHWRAQQAAAQVRADSFERRYGELRAQVDATTASIGASTRALGRAVLGRPLRLVRRRIGRTPEDDPVRDARIVAVGGDPLFDAAWYLAQNPDVAAAGVDPATHYVLSGGSERRAPGPAFDAAWYVGQHADAVGDGVTPLEHYARHGRHAGWATQPFVDTVQSSQVPDYNVVEEQSVVDAEVIEDEAVEPDVPTAVGATDPVEPPAPNPLVLYISGEADTPGSQYRCVRYAAAAREAGWSAGWARLEQVGAADLVGVEVVVLWRVRWSQHVANIEEEVRRGGGIVVFDIDDLMFRPELARTSIIDGMRTTNAGIGQTRETFSQVQQAMASADLCTATTDELADHMREWQKATYVLPNGFDDATHAHARLAVRVRARGGDDGLVRIGYAAGTVTHQKDFLTALPGLIRVLQVRPQVRLVLFRMQGGGDLVMIDEFDELLPYLDRIEWRDRVTLDELPGEIARFDINIAPLERGNPFCEAKSELKYFEAALADVPTVASATGPFARAIAHGRTGMLAHDAEGWHDALLRLIDDAGLRRSIGRAAYVDCLWRFGPRRRAELAGAFLEQIRGTQRGAREFALEVLQARERAARPVRMPALGATETLHSRDMLGLADVTVIVPCYNYAEYVIEALESVRVQTLAVLDLVVVDDCSTDPLCVELIMEWVRRHESRFNRVLVLRHVENAGLSAARNTGFHAAESAYVLPLDADNRLQPECCFELLDALLASRAAYAYPSIRQFHADDAVFCNERYQPMRFVGGNYIDAMALIAKWSWAAAGGYDMPRRMGWEDFDLWCRLAELGQRGVHVNRVLAEYRVHGGSMLDALVEVESGKQQTVALVEERHDWLRLSSRKPAERV